MMSMDALMAWHRARPRLAIGVHIIVPVAFLATALIAQFGFDISPCDLCLKQRIPYAVIALLALGAWFMDRKWTPWALALIALLYVTETGIAFFHVGVEHRWWSAGCGFKSTASDVRAMYEQLIAAPITPCDKVEWTFLGLSMATWNVGFAAALAVFTALQAWIQRVWWTARTKG